MKLSELKPGMEICKKYCSGEFFLATPDRYAAMHHAICKYLDEQASEQK